MIHGIPFQLISPILVIELSDLFRKTLTGFLRRFSRGIKTET